MRLRKSKQIWPINAYTCEGAPPPMGGGTSTQPSLTGGNHPPHPSPKPNPKCGQREAQYILTIWRAGQRRQTRQLQHHQHRLKLRHYLECGLKPQRPESGRWDLISCARPGQTSPEPCAVRRSGYPPVLRAWPGTDTALGNGQFQALAAAALAAHLGLCRGGFA
jgi:hypothetical protein